MIRSAVLTKNELPRRANSICLIAPELALPDVTLKVVINSLVLVL